MLTAEQPTMLKPAGQPGAIHTDNGAERGQRTRLFRDCATGTGVEWIYAVDYAGPCPRWYGFLAMGATASIDTLVANGMNLEPYRG